MFSFEMQPVFRGATWIDDALMVDQGRPGEPIDLTGGDITLKVYPMRHRDYGGFGFWGDYEFISYPGIRRPILVATIGAGLIVPELGLVQWRFEAEQTFALWPGEYRMSMTFARDGDTDEILDCIVQVME